MASIYILKGDGKGKQFELSSGSNVVGRNRTCPIRFNDIEISRQHLDLKFQADGLFAEDLGSANGTYLNGQPLLQSTRLQSGDRLMIGKVLLLINLAGSAPMRGEISSGEGSLSSSGDAYEDDEDSVSVNFKSVRENLEFLYSASVTASSAQETDEMLEQLLNLVFEWIDVDRGAVLLWDADIQEFIPRYLKHRSHISPGPIQFSRTIINYVRKHRQGVLSGSASD
ncbi:MAG: FHA domain-containing protein, partial [Planctomycetota bacterium]